MITRRGIRPKWRVLEDVMGRKTRWIKGGSGLLVWMLWACPLLRGESPLKARVDVGTLMGGYRTGVRAAVDWLFIRVQNSRRYVTSQCNHCGSADAIGSRDSQRDVNNS